MLRLTSNVQIGPYRFNAVHEIEVESSWENLTDTCTIAFPRQISWQGRELATGPDPLLKRGMSVKVEIGYDDQNTEVFRGYIRDISADIPAKVMCEDEMLNLKKGVFNASYREADIAKIVSDSLGAIGVKTPFKITLETKIGQFRVSKSTPAKILEYLKEHYFIRSFFREGKLYVGLPYVAELQRQRKIRFDRNVVNNSLEYREKDDVSLYLKAVIMKPDNKKEEVFEGDKGGEQRTFHYYNISKSEAQKLLKQEAERLRYTGYRGRITIFGRPDVRHGDVVELLDPNYPERQGKYLVRSVKITFGQSGYRQELELENKVK